MRLTILALGRIRDSFPFHTRYHLVILEIYRDQGKMAKAERMYTQVVAGKEKKFGSDHISTLYTVPHSALSPTSARY